jgi:hypothetical protein
MRAPKHSPGPWKALPCGCIQTAKYFKIPIYGALRIEGHKGRQYVGIPQGACARKHDFRLAQFDEERDANARLIASAPELLNELKLAHKIILNALKAMSSKDQTKWCELNERDGLKDGLACTREEARRLLIERAEGE